MFFAKELSCETAVYISRIFHTKEISLGKEITSYLVVSTRTRCTWGVIMRDRQNRERVNRITQVGSCSNAI